MLGFQSLSYLKIKYMNIFMKYKYTLQRCPILVSFYINYRVFLPSYDQAPQMELVYDFHPGCTDSC